MGGNGAIINGDRYGSPLTGDHPKFFCCITRQMRWTAHRNDWAPDGTLGAQLGDAVEIVRTKINGFESLRLSGLGTHIFALTHLVVNRAVVSSCRWLTPFEAWSLHPAMFRRIHSLGCPSSTAWLLDRLRMNVLMHISLHLRILVVIFNPCCRHQGHSKETNIWKKNTRKKNIHFLGMSIPVWSPKKHIHLPRSDGRTASAAHITEANKAKRSGMVSTSQVANKRTFFLSQEFLTGKANEELARPDPTLLLFLTPRPPKRPKSSSMMILYDFCPCLGWFSLTKHASIYHLTLRGQGFKHA